MGLSLNLHSFNVTRINFTPISSYNISHPESLVIHSSNITKEPSLTSIKITQTRETARALSDLLGASIHYIFFCNLSAFYLERVDCSLASVFSLRSQTIGSTREYTSYCTGLELINNALHTGVRADREECNTNCDQDEVHNVTGHIGDLAVMSTNLLIGFAHSEVGNTPEDEPEPAVEKR
jgi:hypothetical protein